MSPLPARVLCGLVGLLLGASATSTLLQSTDPALALALNPFNSEARVGVVVNALASSSLVNRTDLEPVALDMIRFSPADGRGYSLLAAIRETDPQDDTPAPLYMLALAHAPTELQALRRLTDLHLQRRDVAGALEYVDILLRRWPEYWDRLAPILSAAASDPMAARRLADQLDRLPPWRARAVRLLAGSEQGLDFLFRLVADAPEAVQASPEWRRDRETVVAALAKAGQAEASYAFFLSTRDDAEAKLASYVFDPHFTAAAPTGYFGWQLSAGSTTQMQMPASSIEGRGGLEIAFSDAPVKGQLAAQTLVLPFGTFQLDIDYTTHDLVMPRGLFWQVACANGAAIARIDVDPADQTRQLRGVDFSVPTSGCPTQTLSLKTEVRTSTWRDRYQGHIVFATVAISRRDSDPR